MEWVICEKKEDRGERYRSNAAREALCWFFEKNGVGQNAGKVYGFLKQFLWSERISGDYGRLFFAAQGDGLELQKFTGHRGFHDDHTNVTTVYLTCAPDVDQPSADWPMEINSSVNWKPLEDSGHYYRKEWFAGCSNVKVFLEKRIVMGSYYGEVICPIFLITDMPGARGRYLLKMESFAD